MKDVLFQVGPIQVRGEVDKQGDNLVYLWSAVTVPEGNKINCPDFGVRHFNEADIFVWLRNIQQET